MWDDLLGYIGLGSGSDVSPKSHAKNFDAAIDAFKTACPDEWEAWKTCPLESGLREISTKLKGY